MEDGDDRKLTPDEESLRAFVLKLAKDPQLLGEFLENPEQAISRAELPCGAQVALSAFVPSVVANLILGVPKEQAWALGAPIKIGGSPLKVVYCSPEEDEEKKPKQKKPKKRKRKK